jgi:50S ribosomal protein L16 3-hydroxylase
MLREWLAPLALETFVRDHLGKMPYARSGAAAGVVPCFGWEALEQVLATRPPDVLVAAAGRLVNAPVPGDLSSARKLLSRGFGFVIRRSERQNERLAQIARAFACDLPGEVQVQLYVTPAGTQTFGWHFDFEEVFIAQTVGMKDYYFRDNTVARQVAMGPDLDFRAIRHETSPLFASQLIAGDWLYIPQRWWHLVRSVEDSLSISIGVVPQSTNPRVPCRQLPSPAPCGPPSFS